MSFSALQSRVNSAVLVHLSDAATLGGVAVRGKFDNGSANALSGMVLGTNPTFTLADADAVGARGKPFIYGSVNYTVTAAKPDGHGMTLLELQKA